jgi:GT2 family glycosyltransferase
MTDSQPKVSVLITARDREAELQQTLRSLRNQTYPLIEVIVIDDCSDVSLESVVIAEWPEARFIRNEKSVGYIASRSACLRLASGHYVLSLDDDSCLTRADDLERCVGRMESEPRVGVLAFLVFHGLEPPDSLPVFAGEKYGLSFVGCGHMIRTAVIREVGAYCDFYQYYGEEAELSLRVLDAGWLILWFPSVLVHHRVSPIGRNRGRIIEYSFRNNLWTLALRMPWRRAITQGCWRFVSHSIECFRLLELKAWMNAIVSFGLGLPMVLRLRKPIRPQTLDRYDLVRARTIKTQSELDSAQRPSALEMAVSIWNGWRNRPRARPFWDRRPGDLGVGDDNVFAHQFPRSDR